MSVATEHAGGILLAGFEPYAGRGLNPASEVVRALDGTSIGGHAVTGRFLPVSLDRSADLVEREIRRLSPVVVLCLGLWPGESMIRIERRAANFLHSEVPDNEGSRHFNTQLEPSGPAAREASIQIESALDALLSKGIPARASESAGTFLCNAVFYRALRIAEENDGSPPCGFVHLPYLPEQVAMLVQQISKEGALEAHQRSDYASMSLDLMARAVSIIIGTMLRTER